MKSPRLIALLYLVLLAGCGVWAGALFLDARAEYDQLCQINASSAAKLAAAEARFREQEVILERLRTDPEFVATTIRRQLAYGKPGEVTFRFDWRN